MSLPVGLFSGLIMMATDGTTLDSGNMIPHCAGGGGTTGGSSYMNPHCAGEGGTTGGSANTTPTGVSSGDSTPKASSSNPKPRFNLLPEPENKKIIDTLDIQRRHIDIILQEAELLQEYYKAEDLAGPDGDTTEADAIYNRGMKELADLKNISGIVGNERGGLGTTPRAERRTSGDNTCLADMVKKQVGLLEDNNKKLQQIERAQAEAAEQANKTNK